MDLKTRGKAYFPDRRAHFGGFYAVEAYYDANGIDGAGWYRLISNGKTTVKVRIDDLFQHKMYKPYATDVEARVAAAEVFGTLSKWHEHIVLPEPAPKKADAAE